MTETVVSLKRNVIANYLGQGWGALMGFIFIPVYIRYLGMEAFALVGIFGMLQAWLALLDMGMKPALAREMARFSAGKHTPELIRDLLRSVVIVGLAIACAIALGVWLASGWLAGNWLTAERLPIHVVADAIAWMGVVVACRFVENIYVNSLVGLQYQVAQNLVGALMATLRGAGVIGVLAWLSPTIQAFFIWQGIISLASIAVFSALVYRALPRGTRPAHFSWPALSHIWRFAAGMLVIGFLALLLTQVDKVILSRLLTLEAFGYYALATMVANALRLIPSPITTAIYPRLTQLAARDDGEPLLRGIYHQCAQLVTVLMGSASLVLIVFSDQILLLWTGDATVTSETAPLLSVLALGTFLNGLMWIPYQLQLAHGWTSLAIRINVVAVAILVPAIWWLASTFGALGAAWGWVALNVGYLLFTVHFMHRRLLPREKWRWYFSDVAMPLAPACVVAVLGRALIPDHLGRTGELAALVGASAFVLLAAALAAPLIRKQAISLIESIAGVAGWRARQ